MTPADAAAVERAQRVQARPADATPEVAAGLAADVLALAAALRKLRWCVANAHRGAALAAVVEPAALCAWLLAHGWREDVRAEGRHARSYERVDHRAEDWLVLVPKDSARAFRDYGRALAETLREAKQRVSAPEVAS